MIFLDVFLGGVGYEQFDQFGACPCTVATFLAENNSLQDKLPRLVFLKSCQIHPETGSLLFTYEPTEEKEAEMDRLAEFLEKQIFYIY